LRQNASDAKGKNGQIQAAAVEYSGVNSDKRAQSIFDELARKQPLSVTLAPRHAAVFIGLVGAVCAFMLCRF
jgi:hypothetical protein